MSAQVIPFPVRAIPLERADRFTLLGQVRSICIGKQLNGCQKAIVIGLAEHWMDLNLSAEDVKQRARRKADELRKLTNGGVA